MTGDFGRPTTVLEQRRDAYQGENGGMGKASVSSNETRFIDERVEVGEYRMLCCQNASVRTALTVNATRHLDLPLQAVDIERETIP